MLQRLPTVEQHTLYFLEVGMLNSPFLRSCVKWAAGLGLTIANPIMKGKLNFSYSFVSSLSTFLGQEELRCAFLSLRLHAHRATCVLVLTMGSGSSQHLSNTVAETCHFRTSFLLFLNVGTQPARKTSKHLIWK